MRPITIEGFAKLTVPTGFGPAPQLQWLEIRQLVVDDSYQRPVNNRGNVRAIAEAFDWRRFAPVIVSPIEGGFYAIIDGQHRTTAAALCGIEKVPCDVVLADRGEQAIAFAAINGNVTQVSRHQMFKAALAGGDPEARRIQAVAEAAGVRILFWNVASNLRAWNETVALNCITRLVKAYGDETVTLGLRSILQSANGETGYLSALIIRAVVEVLADHPEWRGGDELDAAMRDFDLRSEQDEAHMLALRHRGQTTILNLQAALVTHLERTMAPQSARRVA